MNNPAEMCDVLDLYNCHNDSIAIRDVDQRLLSQHLEMTEQRGPNRDHAGLAAQLASNRATDNICSWGRSPEQGTDDSTRPKHRAYQVSWRAWESGSQLLPLGGDAHRAVVGVTHPGHDAACGNHGYSAKAKLVTSQRCRNEDISAAAHATINSQCHSLSQLIHHKRLHTIGHFISALKA